MKTTLRNAGIIVEQWILDEESAPTMSASLQTYDWGAHWYRNQLSPGRVPEFLSMFCVVGRFSSVSGQFSSPLPGLL